MRSLLTTAFAVLSLLLGHGSAAQDVEAGLVARYALDGDVTDDGPNGYNGRLVGSPTWVRGVSGSALRFGGDGAAVHFTGIPASTFNAPFSAAWFMQLSDLRRYSLLSKRNDCTVSNHFDVRLGSTAPELIGFELSRALQLTPTVARAAVDAGPWVHVAIVRDSAAIRVFVDGRAGADVAIGTSNLSGVTAPLAFGDSPCIGTPDGTLAFRGLLDEVRVYNRALSSAEVATLARVASVSVAPASASAGATLRVTMNNLDVGRSYELRLRRARVVDRLLVRLTADATSEVVSADVPSVAVGEYEIALFERPTLTIGSGTLLRTTPFVVAPGLTFSDLTAQPQAGKRMQATIGNLAAGSLQLRYGSRIVAGPVPVSGGTQTLRFLLPADFPASFPASVVLKAELHAGRVLARSGSTTLTVAAPFSGRFSTISALGTSTPTPRPRDPVRVTGTLVLADGATPADVQVSVFWVGNNGQVTPLPTSALSVGADGRFVLDSVPPSLAGMTAVTGGAGRLRVVTRRFNAVSGRPEFEVTEGPNLETVHDLDPQTDITLRVLVRSGNNTTAPLEGAYVVLDADAPLQLFDPPPPPAGSTQSTYATSGGAVALNRQPAMTLSQSGAALANQMQSAIGSLQLPPPECGSSLFRRYTDGTGRAEFLIQGNDNGTPSGFQSLQATRFAAQACTGVACSGAQVQPVYEFNLTVYTLHKGAGYREDNNSNAEAPSRFRIRYDRAAGTFTITDLRTNQTTVQQTSANIQLVVPAVTAQGSFVTISDPLVYQSVGTSAFLVPRIGSNGYGQWVDFEGLAGQFVNAAPVRHIRFAHRPDAAGSIVSAALYLPNLITGQPSQVGTFSRVSNVAGCNIQEDGSTAGSETWELQIAGPLSQSWRTPRGVFFRNDASERRACGYIESINARGGSGRRNICFVWQALPGSLAQAAGSMEVDDSDPNDVRFARSGQVFNDARTEATLPPEIDGEPVNEPRRRNNRSQTSRATFDRITASGPASAARSFAGANPAQFAESGAGRTGNANLGGSQQVTFGEDAYQNIVDQTVVLFGWVWGVPELFGATVHAELRVLADYYFYGKLRKTSGGERLDMTTDARFGLFISAVADIDVLFGLLFDVGASVTGYAQSTMPTVVENNAVVRSGPCFYIGMYFTGYFDPCTLCPTPRYEETVPIIDERTPQDCPFFTPPDSSSPLLADAKGTVGVSPITAADQRAMRRHPALAFGNDGNGQMLMLDGAQELVVGAIENGVPQPTVRLSDAPNARQPQVAYYAPDRAIAVWVESALPRASVAAADNATLARNQRIAYALYNGAGWLPKAFLTAPGTGEGFPVLGACFAGKPGCPAAGEVALAWQRNESGDYTAPRHRIRVARFTPGTGWGAVSEVAPGSTGVQDITPTVAYLGANPLVAWVRQQGTSLDAFDQRRLAYRHVGVGVPQVANALPTGVIAPTLHVQGGAVAAPTVRLAFTRADDGTGQVGTRQALHLGASTCAGGTCNWTSRRAQDRFGRSIYGERPRFVATSDGDAPILMRAFQFRGAPGEPVRDGDPYGLLVSSGDVVSINVDAASGVARVVPVTADGASHFGLAAAFNPATEEIMTLAATYLPPNLPSPAAVIKAAGPASVVGFGKSVATVGALEMRALAANPDLVVESVASTTSTPAPGAPMRVTVRVGNRGTAYATARDGTARLELRWNLATGSDAPLAAATLADLAAGASRELVLDLVQPAGAFADEPHTVYAAIVPGDSLVELSGDNNVGTLAFPGLPEPKDIASFSVPGVAPVQLGWPALADPRIAGYRVYRREGTEWVPLGATPNNGFLDLSAQFGVERIYAVAAYSARGVESPLSAPVAVTPAIMTTPTEALFGNGFEPAAGPLP